MFCEIETESGLITVFKVLTRLRGLRVIIVLSWLRILPSGDFLRAGKEFGVFKKPEH